MGARIRMSDESFQRYVNQASRFLNNYGQNSLEHIITLKRLHKRGVNVVNAVSMIIGSRPFPWEKENLLDDLPNVDDYFLPDFIPGEG